MARGARRATRAKGRSAAPIEVTGHGHGHGHGDTVVDTSAVDADEVVARRVRLVVAGLLVPLIVAAVVLTIALWPTGKVTSDALVTEQGRGQIVSVKPCPGKDAPSCDLAAVKITSATVGGTGQEVPVQLPKGKLAPKLERGDRIMLGIVMNNPPDQRYTFIDHDRGRPLMLLAGLFAIAVVALSRWRGLAALGALVVTGLVLTQFVLPAILKGSDPLLIAVVGGTLIMVLALFMTHGVNAQTAVAMVGTIAALGLTAVLGKVFVAVSQVTGLSSDVGYLESYVGRIDLQGLVVAGLVIGALGVLDDVTVTQASAVWELSAANPAASRAALIGAGLRIGRAHVASVVNTLTLAYAGSALPTLLLFAASAAPSSYTVSTEDVAIQVISGLVGSLGIIAAVPITTALAALAVGARSD